MTLSYKLLKSSRCSVNDKIEECFPLVNYFTKLSGYIQKIGIAALDSEVKNQNENFLLKKGLKLVSNGTSPKIIEKILMNYLYTSNTEGKALLKNILVAEGILLIQQNLHPRLIEEILVSYLGEDVNEHLANHLYYSGLKDEQIRAFINGYLKSISNKSSIIEEDEVFTSLTYDIRLFQKIVGQFDINCFAYALCCLSEKIQRGILYNFSDDIAFDIVARLSEITEMDDHIIQRGIECQKEIGSKLIELENLGEIVLFRKMA